MMVNRGGRSEEFVMEYRGSALTNAATTVTKPAGVAVGDVVIFVMPDAAASGDSVVMTTFGGDNWTKSKLDVPAGSYEAILFAKILTALDVSSAWLLTSAEVGRAYAWIGNDAGSVAVQRTTVNPVLQSSLSFSGFAPDNTHGVIAVLVDRDPDVTPTIGGGFTIRSSALTNGFWIVTVADNLDGYAGAAVVFGATNGVSGAAEYGWLLKVGFV